MPICTLFLLSLQPASPVGEFLPVLLSNCTVKPLVVSQVIRWIILPVSIQARELLTHQWDLLLIFPGTPSSVAFPQAVKEHVHAKYILQAGVPSALIKDFDASNDKLLHPHGGDVPALTGAFETPMEASNSQGLEMSDELRAWIKDWDPKASRGAVSMLNLLAFKENKHAEYLKYGKAFAERVGSERGGKAKIVGKVTGGPTDGDKSEWDEIALAHYPSILHFADMISSQDYQEVNHKHRIGSLKDTCILFTSELELPSESSSKSKL